MDSMGNIIDIMSDTDDIDRRLLAELRRDGRASLTTLSERLGVPRVTLHDHLRRLRASGTIRRFTVVVDPVKEGLGTTAFVFVSFEKTGRITQRSVAERVGRLPGVYEVHIMAGEWDLLLKVRGPNLTEIGDLVIDHLRAVPGIAATVTHPCFATVKEEI